MRSSIDRGGFALFVRHEKVVEHRTVAGMAGERRVPKTYAVAPAVRFAINNGQGAA